MIRMQNIQSLSLVWVILLCCILGSVNAEQDYYKAKWDPIHFQPAISNATDKQCLSCHQEINQHKVLTQSPAGVKAQDSLAWYQTLDTYTGEQMTFHQRHISSDYAVSVMKLKCNTCHQGNDPREETANSSATTNALLTQRKHVDPQICFMCHGQFNGRAMGIVNGWMKDGKNYNNDCLVCHQAISLKRHESVGFLKKDAIENLARAEGGDVCYGCHGGRAWYANHYPYKIKRVKGQFPAK